LVGSHSFGHVYPMFKIHHGYLSWAPI
jgi:hypothetical protein